MKGAVVVILTALAIAAPAVAQTTMTPMPGRSGALHEIALTPASLAGLPRRTLTVTEESDTHVTYSGVDLDALLAKNGAPHGMGLRGAAAADYVVVKASDGYRTVFALAE